MSIKKTRLVLLLASLILCLASFLPAVAVQAEDTFKVNAKAAFAVDAQSSQPMLQWWPWQKKSLAAKLNSLNE